MGTSLIDNFDYRGRRFLDGRQSVATQAALRGVPETSVPDGFRAHCAEDGQWYEYNSGNAVDATTGKWRRITTEVAQTTGDRADIPMSQKAVTTEIEYLSQDVDIKYGKLTLGPNEVISNSVLTAGTGFIGADGSRQKSVCVVSLPDIKDMGLSFFSENLGNGNHGAAFFDSDGTFISGVNSGGNAVKTIVVPANASTFKFTVTNASLPQSVEIHNLSESTNLSLAKGLVSANKGIDTLAGAIFPSIVSNDFESFPLNQILRKDKKIANNTEVKTGYFALKKGERITLSSNAAIRYGGGDYYVFAVMNESIESLNANELFDDYFIDGKLLTECATDLNFEWTADRDCMVYATIPSASGITVEKYSNTIKENKDSICSHIEAFTPEILRTGCGISSAIIKEDGTLGGSSVCYLYHASLEDVSRVRIFTASSVETLSWATYRGDGSVSRRGEPVKICRSNTPDRRQLAEYIIEILDDEKLIKFVAGYNIVSNGLLEYSFHTKAEVVKKTASHTDDLPLTGFIDDNENIYMTFARMMNSHNLESDIANGKIFDFEESGGKYGDPSDCTIAFDEKNFYFVGSHPNATGQSTNKTNDINMGIDCGVELHVISRADSTQKKHDVALMGQIIVDIYGHSHTIQVGASMANAIVRDGKLYILFDTKVDDEFVVMRCVYDPATDSLGQYCICTLESGERLTVSSLLKEGHELVPVNTTGIPSGCTINMNASFYNAEKDGVYYIGACLSTIYRYPFIFETSDFEKFSVFCQLSHPRMWAQHECATAIKDGYVWCATRCEANGWMNYLIVNKVSLTTKDIEKTCLIRDGGSRPCLFLGWDDEVYLAHALDSTRQSGRIMKLSGINGNQDFFCDWMQTVQYAEFMKSDYEGKYLMFAYNRIYEVKFDHYNYLNARKFVSKLISLYEGTGV